MVTKLSQYTDMKFIWAEISYLSMWWAEQPVATRTKVLQFLDEGRLEVSAANRLIGEVVQSRRRPLLGPSPG